MATPKHRVADIFVEHVLAADPRRMRSRGFGTLHAIGRHRPTTDGGQTRGARRLQASGRKANANVVRRSERTHDHNRTTARCSWLPQMDVLNGVLGGSADDELPTRNIDGVVTQVRVRRVPNMHALTPNSSNGEATEDTQLPPPDQPLLTRLNEDALAELIERHIEYIDGQGRPVHLGTAFVRHYLSRADDALPIVVAIATLPIAFRRKSPRTARLRPRPGIVFHVPEELLSLLPTRDQCDDAAVRKAFKFLHDEWSMSPQTSRANVSYRCGSDPDRAISTPDRPAFFVTAGRRVVARPRP